MPVRIALPAAGSKRSQLVSSTRSRTGPYRLTPVRAALLPRAPPGCFGAPERPRFSALARITNATLACPGLGPPPDRRRVCRRDPGRARPLTRTRTDAVLRRRHSGAGHGFPDLLRSRTELG